MLPVLLFQLVTVELLQNYLLLLRTIRQVRKQLLTQNALLQRTRNAGILLLEFYRHLAPKHGKVPMNMHVYQFSQTSTAVKALHPSQQSHSPTIKQGGYPALMHYVLLHLHQELVLNAGMLL